MWTDGYARTSGSIRRDVYEATATVQGQKLNTTAAMCEVAQMDELCLCSWWSGRVTSHSLSISTQVLLLDVHAATNIPQILYVICYLLNRKKNGNDHSELFCIWWSWLKWRHGEAGGIFCTSSTKFVGVICIISTFDADSTCVWSDCQVGRDDRKVVKHRKYICWFCWWAFWWDYRPTGTFTPDQEPFVHNQAKLSRRKMCYIYTQTKLD